MQRHSISTLEHKKRNAQPWHIHKTSSDDTHRHIHVDTILMCDIFFVTRCRSSANLGKCRSKRFAKGLSQLLTHHWTIVQSVKRNQCRNRADELISFEREINTITLDNADGYNAISQITTWVSMDKMIRGNTMAKERLRIVCNEDSARSTKEITKSMFPQGTRRERESKEDREREKERETEQLHSVSMKTREIEQLLLLLLLFSSLSLQTN